MHHIAIQRRRRAILGKQRDLFGLLTALVKRFDRLAPCRSLVVVDLSQMQHMPLHRAPGGHTAVFNDTPIAVLLAVLAANLVAQKHDASLPKPPAVSQGAWSAPHAVPQLPRAAPAPFSGLSTPPDSKIPETNGE